MKFGIRECCDVTFRAKAPMKLGDKVFFKGEPVLIFDTLKTSTLEGATTTVYAQGGKGNARLIGWDGDRTLTFTMEDALISTEGMAILAAANLDKKKDSLVHTTFKHMVDATDVSAGKITIDLEGATLGNTESDEDFYVMLIDDEGDLLSEVYSAKSASGPNPEVVSGKVELTPGTMPAVGTIAILDCYIKKDTTEIEIAAESLSSNFYIEGSTLYRTQTGRDVPAELIIPNGKVQSNFSFTYAGTGDPSTFTFTVDAFPDYAKTNSTKKLLAVLQIVDGGADNAAASAVRDATPTVTYGEASKSFKDGIFVGSQTASTETGN